MTPDPNHYGLLVVQAAVRAGAREVRVTHRGWLTSFELLGGRIPPTSLDRLEDLAHGPGPESALAEAVRLVSQSSPREVRLSCQGRQLRLRGGRRTVLDQGPPDLRLEVDRRPALHRQVLSPYPHALEDQPLRDRCHLSPIPISLNGTPLRGRFSLKGCLRAILLDPDSEQCGRLPLYLPARGLVERLPGPRGSWSALGLHPDEAESATVVVVDGVSQAGPRLRGLRAAVWTSEQSLQAGLLERLPEELQRALEVLHDNLWDGLPGMTPAQRVRALPYLQQLAPSARLPQLKRLMETDEGSSHAVLLSLAAARARAEGDLIEAQAYYLKALEHPEANRTDLLPSLVQIMRQLRVRPRQLEPYVREIYAGLPRRKAGYGREALVGFFEQMGQYAAANGFPAEARGYLTEALALQEGLLGRHHPSVERLRETLDSL